MDRVARLGNDRLQVQVGLSFDHYREASGEIESPQPQRTIARSPKNTQCTEGESRGELMVNHATSSQEGS